MSALPPIGDLASVQVRASNVVSSEAVFIGIAKTSDVERYLQDVAHSSFGHMNWSPTGAWPGHMSWLKTEDARSSSGGRAPATPGEQDFWTVSASGTGPQDISWRLEPGQWSMVVMNSDGSAPVWADVQPGVRSELLGPIGNALLFGGLVGLVLGIPLLLLGTAGLGRDIDPEHGGVDLDSGAGTEGNPVRGKETQVYPAWLTGVLDSRLSRWLWLVKWLLAVPHYLVLAFLWVALLVTTIAAGLAILFSGRYPRAWFVFNVGVLRWSWRVAFYGYSVLGTDSYPPFTLARTGYPADFDVAPPQRLSRGLVLVKWWLLAIPHLLLIGIFTSGTGAAGSSAWGEGAKFSSNTWGPSLLGLLVLIAAVILLFTGCYAKGLFALIMGLNRWVYRVAAYVLLMRDEYPPFRLDQGPFEPVPTAPGPGLAKVTEQWPPDSKDIPPAPS